MAAARQVLAALVVDELVNRGDSDSDEEEQRFLKRLLFSIFSQLIATQKLLNKLEIFYLQETTCSCKPQAQLM
jgi:hypothetical protein